jgi:HNH endonuclease
MRPANARTNSIPAWPSKPAWGRTFVVRFWAKVEKTDGCWIWRGGRFHTGYGRVFRGGVVCVAHRVAYELAVGPIPKGLEMDHLCRNRACVNPAHLEPVPQRINTLRGVGITAVQAARTHCPQGHTYDEANTWLYKGHRHCRECRRVKCREYEKRRAPRPPRRARSTALMAGFVPPN